MERLGIECMLANMRKSDLSKILVHKPPPFLSEFGEGGGVHIGTSANIIVLVWLHIRQHACKLFMGH